MPTRSRARTRRFVRASHRAMANMPRSRATKSAPMSSYRWTIVSVSLRVLKRCPPATSMIESLRMPSATSGATKYPLSSGPRWTIASHIVRTVRAASSSPNGHPAKPAMPHIALRPHPGGGHERLVPGAQALDDTTLMIFRAGVCLCGSAEGLRSPGRLDDGAEGCGEGSGIAGRHEHAGFTVAERVGHSADAGRDHGPRGRHALENRIGERFGDRAQHRHVEQMIEVEPRCQGTGELDAPVQVQTIGQAGELGALRPVTHADEVGPRNVRRDAGERVEQRRVILVAIQSGDDADDQRVGRDVQPGAPGGSLADRQGPEGVFGQTVGDADDLRRRNAILVRQERGHGRAVRDHAVGCAVRPAVCDLLRPSLSQLPPPPARYHGRNSSNTSPRHAEDVAADVLGVKHLDALAAQEPRQADPVSDRARPIQAPQRHVHQVGAGLHETRTQGTVRPKVNDGYAEPLAAETLDPPERVELRAADLESLDAESEPNHGSQPSVVPGAPQVLQSAPVVPYTGSRRWIEAKAPP